MLDQLRDVDVLTEEGRRQNAKIIREMEAPDLHRTLEDFKRRNPSYIRAKQKFEEASAEYVNSANYLYLSVAGAVLSAAGFYLWFTRLQRFLDQQLVAAGGQAHRVKSE